VAVRLVQLVLQWVEQEVLEQAVLLRLEAVRYLLQAVEQEALEGEEEEEEEEREQAVRLVFLALRYRCMVSLVINLL
jgi:hypothetical protein